MYTFILALILDAALIVFAIAAIFFAHGFFGLIVYIVASVFVHILYNDARARMREMNPTFRRRRSEP